MDMTREEVLSFVASANKERGGAYANKASVMAWGICPVCQRDTLFAERAPKSSTNTCGREACEQEWRKQQ